MTDSVIDSVLSQVSCESWLPFPIMHSAVMDAQGAVCLHESPLRSQSRKVTRGWACKSGKQASWLEILEFSRAGSEVCFSPFCLQLVSLRIKVRG